MIMMKKIKKSNSIQMMSYHPRKHRNFDFPTLKNQTPGQLFVALQLKQIPLNFKTSCSNLKIRGLGKNGVKTFSIYASLSRYLILKRIVPRFFYDAIGCNSCRKGISKFPRIVILYLSFMNTTGVRLSHNLLKFNLGNFLTDYLRDTI